MSSPADGDGAAATEEEVEQVARALHQHLAEGRITLDDFDVRAATLYAGTTRAGVREALAGLPLLDAEEPSGGGRRRHGEQQGLRPHWVATEEVFRDPTTKRVMRVWVDPTDGTRHYAEDGG